MKESRHIWMSHVTHTRSEGWDTSWPSRHMNECVTSHTNESRHIWIMSHTNEPCHIRMSHVTYEWVMSHIWMSHVTYEWVMSHIWMSHVTYEWVMSHIWMSHVTYEWVMSDMMSHATDESVTSHMNASRHIWKSHVTYEWVMSHTHGANGETPVGWVDIWMNASRHIWIRHVTYEWVMSHTHRVKGETRKSPIPVGRVIRYDVCNTSHMNTSCHTQKSPVISGSFAKRNLQLKTSDTSWDAKIACSVAKRRRIPYFYRFLSAKEPCNEWLFCRKRPAT